MALSRTPTLAEVLASVRAGIFRDLRVGMPGRVESFDASTGTADVQPLVREAVEQDDGSIAQVSLPVLTGVPIMFPGGGGLRITFPMAQGDTVWLEFADRSIDSWLATGSEGAPDDSRRHALSDAVAYPGIRPSNSAWTNVEDGVITAGLDSASSSDFVALAAKVKSEISAVRDTLNNFVTSYNSHMHTMLPATSPIAVAGAVGTISGTSGTPVSSATAPASVGDVKSDSFKVRG